MAPNYTQMYRKSWESFPELKDWLRPLEKDKTKAYCAFCKCEITAKLSDLRRHTTSVKHVRAAEPFSSSRQTKLPFSHISDTQRRSSSQAEGRLAMVIAEHSSFLTVDHVSEACKVMFSDSSAVKNLKLHRTKCKNIVVNVLAPHFMESLKDDIADEKYSLLIDESTDIAVTKLLGVIVRYFSRKLRKIVSTFLGIVELQDGTAQSIVNAIKKLLCDVQLDPQNLLGIGVDNASVNVGLNNGVCELLKKELELPNLIMVRCVCHSIQLALSHAVAETLPRNIDFLVRETYSWFSHSSKRQLIYKTLYETLNDGKQPLQVPKLCDTRWISLEPAVTRILAQWEELKMHFNIARSDEKCFTAEMLYNMYSDPINKLYMLFLRPLLQDVQRTVKTFQGENVDPTKLLSDLSYLISATSRRVMIPSSRIDPLTSDIASYIDPRAYLGYEFEKTCSTSNLTQEGQRQLRDRCISCAVKLCDELRNRLPDNFRILKKMSLFSVEECLKVVKEPVIEIAEVLGYLPEQIDKIDSQWRNLTVVRWQETTSTVKFWAEVASYKDAIGVNSFHDLSELALNILSLPHSNAEVERLFSQINIVKSKLRNRLNSKSVSAIITVRSGLRRVGKCCYSYELPEVVVKQIGTMATYSETKSSGATASTSSEPAPHCSSELLDEEADEDLEDTIIFSLN